MRLRFCCSYFFNLLKFSTLIKRIIQYRFVAYFLKCDMKYTYGIKCIIKPLLIHHYLFSYFLSSQGEICSFNQPAVFCFTQTNIVDIYIIRLMTVLHYLKVIKVHMADKLRHRVTRRLVSEFCMTLLDNSNTTQ